MSYSPILGDIMAVDCAEEIKLDEKIKRVPQKPSKYNCILLNDDQTPMEFVIGILQEVFKHTEGSAKDLTMKVHNEGHAIVGTYKYEVAEQKSLETIQLSRNNGFPLVCRVEEQ